MKTLIIIYGVALTSLMGSTVLIQEVYYDQPGADGDAVFTELWGMPGQSLDGWSLVAINQDGATYRTVDLTGGIIPSDGMFVISTSSASVSLAAVSDFTGNVDWQNGPGDALQLRNDSNALIDSLVYGTPNVGGFGEGAPAVDAAEGFSLSRDGFGSDSDDNATDFAQATPSPGVGPAPIPEPSTALLGLLAVSLIMRRRCLG